MSVVHCTKVVVNDSCNNFEQLYILPKVNTDYIRQPQVLNIDNLRPIIYF